jgi:hypothetical protein
MCQTHRHIYTMHPCIDSRILHINIMQYSTMVSWKIYPMPQNIIQTLPNYLFYILDTLLFYPYTTSGI